MTTAAALQSEAQQLPSDTSEPGDQPPVLGQADLPASLGLFPSAAVSRGLGEPVLKVAVACAGLPEGRGQSKLFISLPGRLQGDTFSEWEDEVC